MKKTMGSGGMAEASLGQERMTNVGTIARLVSRRRIVEH